MPILSTRSALNQFRLSNFKPLAFQLYKHSLKILNDQYNQPTTSQHYNFNILNHRRTSNLIDRLSDVNLGLISARQNDDKNRTGKDDLYSGNSNFRLQEQKQESLVKLPKKYVTSDSIELLPAKPIIRFSPSLNTKTQEFSDDNKITPESDSSLGTSNDDDDDDNNSKKKRHKLVVESEKREDEIFNDEPIIGATGIHSKSHISRLDLVSEKVSSSLKEDNDELGNADKSASNNNNSSYGLTLANKRSLIVKNSKQSGRLESSSDDYKSNKKNNNRSSMQPTSAASMAGKAAALALAPSLESIAMRIVSSAASKSIGRSSAHLSSSPANSNNNPSAHSSSSETFPQSILSSLSSTILSTAMSQLINYNSSSPFSSSSSSSTSTSAPSSLSSPISTFLTSTWPNKISPLLYSLASQSGFNLEDSSSILPSASSSFLSSDLSTSSSSNQPTLYTSTSTSSASSKPHTSKQYSPTVMNLVNLARYVLCKYASELVVFEIGKPREPLCFMLFLSLAFAF